MINKDEITYKMNSVIDYLKEKNGYTYKAYNYGCSHTLEEPNYNIVEYAEDVMTMINDLLQDKAYNKDNLNTAL